MAFGSLVDSIVRNRTTVSPIYFSSCSI